MTDPHHFVALLTAGTIRKSILPVVGWHVPAFFVTATLIIGCGITRPDNEKLPRAPRHVAAFVATQNLPGLQGTWTYASIPSESLLVFIAKYGKANDCPAGCFYSTGWGLALGTRIGWMKFDDYDGIDVSSRVAFDPRAPDAALYLETTWNALDTRDHYLLWAVVFPMIAADSDSPAEALLRIADRLYAYISPHVAGLVLDRAEADQDTLLLQKIACLPVFQGDAYQDVRARAREDLGDSFTGCDSTAVVALRL